MLYSRIVYACSHLERDRHYHESEPRQFDMLVEKAGWHIRDTVRWRNPPKSIGLRSLLRYATPRYYGVFAERPAS